MHFFFFFSFQYLLFQLFVVSIKMINLFINKENIGKFNFSDRYASLNKLKVEVTFCLFDVLFSDISCHG